MKSEVEVQVNSAFSLKHSFEINNKSIKLSIRINLEEVRWS